MNQRVNRRKIVAVAFTAALALTETSQAASLFQTSPIGMPATQQSLWSEAWSWMTGLWTGLLGNATSATNATEKTTTTTSTTTTGTEPTTGSSSACVNPSGCTSGDAGWGIDPNG